MKWAVWATPPKTGIYADLAGRWQKYNTGEPVTYDTEDEAKAQAASCNSDRNGWRYEARVFE